MNKSKILAGIAESDFSTVRGRVVEIIGTLIKARISNVEMNEVCIIYITNGDPLYSEVVGFTEEFVLLSPYDDMKGVGQDSEVCPTGSPLKVGVDESLLGRVIGALGEPIDDKGAFTTKDTTFVVKNAPKPMDRVAISEILSVGVRSIDGVLTIGKGQRLGIFAQAGDGKSTLMGMIARNTSADINVIALIGERGREVRDFIEESLGVEGLKRSIIVVATSNESSQRRVNSAYLAAAIADYFREKGKDVLLMMDSVTRFARAYREIGLAAGEPPASGGFPPSVFFMLPKLLEQPGRTKNGSVTALYTILLDGSPIPEEVRSILDGHMMLSRDLASKGWRPSINLLDSLSRLFTQLSSDSQEKKATLIKSTISTLKESELIRRIGEYKAGSDKDVDFALKYENEVANFLKQGMFEKSSLDETMAKMNNLFR